MGDPSIFFKMGEARNFRFSVQDNHNQYQPTDKKLLGISRLALCGPYIYILMTKLTVFYMDCSQRVLYVGQ